MIKLDISILWDILNIIILYFILRKFLIGPVTDIMEKRKAIIAEGLEEAEQKNNEAERLRTEYENQLAKADEDARAIVDRSRQEASAAYTDTVQKAREEADIILRDAKEQAQREKEKAIREAQNEVAGLVMDVTEKVLASDRIQVDDSSIYDDFIKKAGEDNA